MGAGKTTIGKLLADELGLEFKDVDRKIESRAGVEVVQAETLGWKGDAVEAECFAFLAVRVLRGLPISFPSTTGAPEPLRGGKLAG